MEEKIEIDDALKEKIGKNAYYIKSGKYAGLVEEDGKLYIVYDKFEVSDEIKNMSHEEMERQIKILEEEGRREREKIKERKTLLSV